MQQRIFITPLRAAAEAINNAAIVGADTIARTFGGLVSRSLFIVLLAALSSSCSVESKKRAHFQRAEQYFTAGDYEKAKIEYLRVLRLDPGDAKASGRLGTIWLENGDPLYAYAYLDAARKLAPEDVAIRSKLATVLITIGEIAEAQKEALIALEKPPVQDEAIRALTATIRTEQDIKVAEQLLWSIQQHKSAAYDLAWAMIAARKGDLEWAGNELHRALQAEPRSPTVHLALGNFYMGRGNLAEAEREFSAAAGLAPIRSPARLKYAEFQALTNKREAAKTYLRETTRAAPDYMAAWRLLAQIAFDEGKWDESLALLQKIFEQDHVNIEARVLEANVRLAKGDAATAVAELEHLDSTYPHVPVIGYHLARAYLENKQTPQAEGRLDELIGADPDYIEPILLLGELHLQTGKPALAAGAMKALLEKQPELPAAETLLAKAYEKLGRLDDAIAVIREEIRAAPRSADAYFRLGLILRLQEKADESRGAFEQALAYAPDNLPSIEKLVELDISQKNFPAAFHRIEQRLGQEPNLAGAHFIKAKIYFAQGNWDQAAAAVHQALDLDASFLSAFKLLLATYVSSNRLDQVIDASQAFLLKNPDNIEALTNLALTYDKMNDFSKARDAYEKLLSVSPDSVTALNNLACLYTERFDQLDRALNLARKARLLQPNAPLIADTLGWTLYKDADYREAQTVLRESVGKLPDSAEVQFHFGMTSYMMGEAGAARKALGKALASDANFSDKAEARRRLAFLEDGTKKQPTTQELEAVVRQQPDDVIAWSRLGESYEKQGAYAQAANAYEGALKINSELLPAAVKLAGLNSGPLKDSNKAFAFAKEARDLAPDDPQVAGLLGEIVYQLGNFSWAYSLLQESAFRQGDNGYVLHAYAWSAYALGKSKEARKVMQRAIEAHLDSERAEDAKWFLTMTALEENPKRLAESESETKAILAANSSYIPALLAKADLQMQRGDAGSAEGIYNDILRRFPDFPLAKKRLASIYVKDPARINEAYSLALNASNALPDDPELARTLGEISYKRNEFAEAIQWFQESARKLPLHGRELYYLGMSQLRVSQDSEARNTLQQALAAGLQEPQSREAKATLTELQKRSGL